MKVDFHQGIFKSFAGDESSIDQFDRTRCLCRADNRGIGVDRLGSVESPGGIDRSVLIKSHKHRSSMTVSEAINDNYLLGMGARGLSVIKERLLENV